MSAVGDLHSPFAASTIREHSTHIVASNPILIVWIILQILASNAGLPVLAATFIFSKTAKRHPTLINICLVWIISGLVSLMLFYAGYQKGREPPKALCIVQTALIFGVTPMWAVAILVLMYYMRICYNTGPQKPKLTKLQMSMLLAAPYVVYVGFAIGAVVLSIRFPHSVNRTRRAFYCSLHNEIYSNVMQVFTIVVCLVATIIEVNLMVTLYRSWRGIRKAGHSAGVDVQFALRVILFGLYILLALFLDMVSMIQPYSLVPDMYAATIGLAVFFIFGSQRDVLRAWAFWRRHRPACDEQRRTRVKLPRGSSWYPSFTLDGPEKLWLEIQRPEAVYGGRGVTDV